MQCISNAKSAKTTAPVVESDFVACSSLRGRVAGRRFSKQLQNRRDHAQRSAKLSGFALALVGALLAVSCKAVDPEGSVERSAPNDTAGAVRQLRTLGLTRRFDAALGQALGDPIGAVRHAAARSLSLLDDAGATAALGRALTSSDLELVQHSGEGLAYAFRSLGNEECSAISVALVRLSSQPEASRANRALARALGSCEGGDVEAELRALLARDEEAGLAGLSRLARTRKKLQKATFVALLDRALAAPRDPARLTVVLEPLARVPWPPEAGARLLAVETLPPTVVTARILAQVGAPARAKLGALAESPAEPAALEARAARFEALRALARQGASAEPVFARVLSALLPRDEAAAPWARTPRGAELAQILQLAPAEATTEPLRGLLERVALLGLDGAEPEPRLDRVRCDAASRIARSAFDSAPMLRCAAPGTLAFEQARLVALARSPLRLGRLPHFEALLVSSHLRIREAALSVLENHPEALAAEWSKAAIVRALGSEQPGEVIAALGAAGKLPMTTSAALRPALDAAAVRAWPADAAELREALLTFGRARSFESALVLARGEVCSPALPVRRLAREMVQDAPVCEALAVPAGALDDTAARVDLVLETPAGSLTLHLDPRVAPVSVAEIARLAAAGFYDHTEMHRVVPGFVVQFGDPQADGYGGSGNLLRHEPSDGAFGPLRVGLAHAGYDTASSQLFVTTGPATHLDGDYTWLGQAEGPWQDLVVGDRVQGVKISRE